MNENSPEPPFYHFFRGGYDATRNKCIARNKCLTSNRCHATRNKCLTSSNNLK